MGLDPARVPNPTNGLVDASNVADIVFANEALGEALRRTETALAATDAAADATTILGRIGCDLVDGVVDGSGGTANARTAATFAAASTSVMLEVIAGTLQVNGSDAMGSMDRAIQTIVPGTAATTLSVPVGAGLINQARDALTSMMPALPDDVLLKFAVLLGGSSPANVRTRVAAAMTSADLTTLDSLAARVAMSDDTQIGQIAAAAHDQVAATPPVVSFAVTPTS
jgi:hypothetical protein